MISKLGSRRLYRMARLFYVIGASGAGKDSVLHYARSRIDALDRCVFAHRYITRAADAGGENHIALSEKEFDLRSELGLFCIEWASHRLRYGIGIEVRRWLEKGCDVVLNGSRGYMEQAQLAFPELVPVLIEVQPEILRKRLLARDRESSEEIEKRIQRSKEVQPASEGTFKIENNGELSAAGDQFLSIIRSIAVKPCELVLELSLIHI